MEVPTKWSTSRRETHPSTEVLLENDWRKVQGEKEDMNPNHKHPETGTKGNIATEGKKAK